MAGKKRGTGPGDLHTEKFDWGRWQAGQDARDLKLREGLAADKSAAPPEEERPVKEGARLVVNGINPFVQQAIRWIEYGDPEQLRLCFSTYLGIVNLPIDGDGTTLLHLAIRQGDEECALQTIYAGANIHAQDKSGTTPLHLAYSYGFNQVAEQLLFRGAQDNVTDHSGLTPADIKQMA